MAASQRKPRLAEGILRLFNPAAKRPCLRTEEVIALSDSEPEVDSHGGQAVPLESVSSRQTPHAKPAQKSRSAESSNEAPSAPAATVTRALDAPQGSDSLDACVQEELRVTELFGESPQGKQHCDGHSGPVEEAGLDAATEFEENPLQQPHIHSAMLVSSLSAAESSSSVPVIVGDSSSTGTGPSSAQQEPSVAELASGEGTELSPLEGPQVEPTPVKHSDSSKEDKKQHASEQDVPVEALRQALEQNSASSSSEQVIPTIAKPDATCVAYLDQFLFSGAGPAPAPLSFPANFKAPLPQQQRRPPAAPLRAGSEDKPAVSSKEDLEDFDAMSEAERSRIASKWRSFLHPGAIGEATKLQLLVAAILHPKSSEASVRSSLHNLCQWAQPKDDSVGGSGLTVEKLACAAVDDILPCFSTLHWHRAKAGRVISAAKALQDSFQGCVPTDRASLLKLPGLGPKLSNVLVFLLKTI